LRKKGVLSLVEQVKERGGVVISGRQSTGASEEILRGKRKTRKHTRKTAKQEMTVWDCDRLGG